MAGDLVRDPGLIKPVIEYTCHDRIKTCDNLECSLYGRYITDDLFQRFVDFGLHHQSLAASHFRRSKSKEVSQIVKKILRT